MEEDWEAYKERITGKWKDNYLPITNSGWYYLSGLEYEEELNAAGDFD